MNKKNKLSLFDEEKIIDFEKNNEILCNFRHAKFRDSEAKNRLWLKLANENNSYVDIYTQTEIDLPELQSIFQMMMGLGLNWILA